MFILSILTVIISSYLILSIMVKDKKEPSFLYFLLIAFSQVVLSFEVLSLFKAISKTGVLVCNIVFLIFSVILFLKSRKKFYRPETKISLLKKVLKRDKFLMFLSVIFIIFLIFQLITIFVFPINFGDALSYYLPRCTSWIQNGSIMHYATPDTRELIMPVNMEFLYTWVLLFTKSEMGIGIFSFVGYIGAIYVIYKLLRELKFSIRRSLWAIFVFSSFALIVIEMITPCADLFIGALILGSIYLFLRSVKYDNKTALYFSSLSYALAVGTKTTAIIAIPVVFLIFCAISYLYKKSYKYLFYFCLLFIINFFIFSSYNYILNFLQFSNPVSCREQLLLNEFTGGIKGYIANVIKYVFSILDMSGVPAVINLNGLIEYWQTLALKLFGTNIKAGTSSYFPGYFEFNNKMGIMYSALGLMGLLAFLPSLIYSIKRYFKNKTKETIIMSLLGLSLIFNILLFSCVMVFTSYNLRYLLTFVIIAAPVTAYSYPAIKNKMCKLFLYSIMLMYFLGFTYQSSFQPLNIKEESEIYNYLIKNQPVKTAIITSQTTQPIFYIEKLKLHGFHIDKLLLENIENYNISEYNYIITEKISVPSTNIVNYENMIKYSDLFVAKCIYYDKNQRVIEEFKKDIHPAVVECQIPFEYLRDKGFYPDTNYSSEKYTLLKNSYI